MTTSFTFSLNSSFPPLSGYSFYTATVQDVGSQMIVDIHADIPSGQTMTQPYVQTLMLSNTPYTSPSSVGSVASKTVGQTTKSSGASWDNTPSWKMSLMLLMCGVTAMSMVSM